MIFKCAHLADSHLDEDKELDDNVRVHGAMIEQIREAQPDLVCHAGDVFDKRSTIRARNAAAWTVRALASIAPVVIVRGNHDAPGDLDIFGRLRAANLIRVCETPQVIDYDLIGGVPLHLQCFPWFDKSYLAAQLSVDAIANTVGTTAMAAMAARQILQGFRAHLEPGAIAIGVGHLTIGGATASSGQTLIGQGVELAPADLLESGAALWCLGHIHRAQPCGPEERVWYAGSPQRHDYGEPENKGWLLHSIEYAAGEARLVDTQWMQLPARRIERFEIGTDSETDPAKVREVLDEQLEVMMAGDDLAHAWVRLRVQVPASLAEYVDRAALERRLTDAGAASIQYETEIVHQQRVRSEAIATARTPWHQLLAFWEAKQTALDDAQLARLATKYEQLQGREEVTDASAVA